MAPQMDMCPTKILKNSKTRTELFKDKPEKSLKAKINIDHQDMIAMKVDVQCTEFCSEGEEEEILDRVPRERGTDETKSLSGQFGSSNSNSARSGDSPNKRRTSHSSSSATSSRPFKSDINRDCEQSVRRYFKPVFHPTPYGMPHGYFSGLAQSPACELPNLK